MSLPLAPYVHGSTDDREVARLVVQAAFVATFSLVDFDAPPGSRVLDLGTGVGAMAAELARRYPGIALTGVDLSEAQLARAKALHPIAEYFLGNAERLPFADASSTRAPSDQTVSLPIVSTTIRFCSLLIGSHERCVPSSASTGGAGLLQAATSAQRS